MGVDEGGGVAGVRLCSVRLLASAMANPGAEDGGGEAGGGCPSRGGGGSAADIGKCGAPPPMGLSRIIKYDREWGEVTYWYKDHLSQGKKTTVTVDRETFIGRMVEHILPKGFQRIRYYGLQATCKLKKVRAQLAVALQGAVPLGMEAVVKPVKRLTYRERMKQTLGRDPQKCSQCGAEMWLWHVWHPKYRVIYDAGERLRRASEVQDERTLPTGRGRTSNAGVGGGNLLQLSLFAV